MTSHDPDRSQQIESRGGWSFVTYRKYRHSDGSERVWHSRRHRKRLPQTESEKTLIAVATLARCLWSPRQLNWWIGVIFAVGSILFATGSILSLVPDLADTWSHSIRWSSNRPRSVLVVNSRDLPACSRIEPRSRRFADTRPCRPCSCRCIRS